MSLTILLYKAKYSTVRFAQISYPRFSFVQKADYRKAKTGTIFGFSKSSKKVESSSLNLKRLMNFHFRQLMLLKIKYLYFWCFLRYN